MARKFLYLIAVVVVVLFAGAFILNIFANDLSRIAFVPDEPFEEQAPLQANAYADSAMWFSSPAAGEELARWQPEIMVTEDNSETPTPALPDATSGEADAQDASDEAVPPFAVFFVHPTSYLQKAHWNAPLDHAASQNRARLFVKGMASPFASATAIWAPRYRQATFGAFMTNDEPAQQAIEAAYRDVEQAFDQFLAETPADMPIVLAGHSQGALHIDQLLRRRVATTDLAARVIAAYPIGWPISVEHDLPLLGLYACEQPDQTRCIVTWSSYAEPAEPGIEMERYAGSLGLNGQERGESPILCINPLTGMRGGTAPESLNLGTLVPNAELTSGELVPMAVPAKCNGQGLLLIGDPPQLGPYVLPGNNYHVYDIPLFWANLKADVERRARAWAPAN